MPNLHGLKAILLQIIIPLGGGGESKASCALRWHSYHNILATTHKGRTMVQTAPASSRWCGNLLDFGGSPAPHTTGLTSVYKRAHVENQLLVTQLRTSSLHIHVRKPILYFRCCDIDFEPKRSTSLMPKGTRSPPWPGLQIDPKGSLWQSGPR